jgi:hypothetical protein
LERHQAIIYLVAGRLKCPLVKVRIISNTMKDNMAGHYQWALSQAQF